MGASLPCHTVAPAGAGDCSTLEHGDVLQTRVPRNPRTKREQWRPTSLDPGRVELECRGCGAVWHSPHVVLAATRAA